ncbi:ribosome biogenesis GTPase YqeH [Mesobacillus selenatarsenatis]|uniref:GTP-binding protein YqeH, required for biogenesis of 30S ribosome subunit n=1 Tax=Mesobacillus selenatarsenatis (strain DSM 18680 / JCM 14380 / FERM P-15431 / SF-1) TaxID=1321606 RepID=A0A0A8X256_MESS1|nr:ribosome biogenesis GTPase YqeH [Mesobacillus selenatarsenatis]GAM13324.1 GTP-binding protein YqeH, required for biogenesis of 30S ribosome subunit [Mesobacillus selenatarsenatis SF-1]
MSEQFNCTGCGVKIQTENPEELGYAPASSLEKEVVVCQRCFRLKNYNEIQDVSLTDDDFLKILNELSSKDALIVKIVDIFDFNGSWLPGIQRFAGKNPVLLIGNKADLVPKSVKQRKLIDWMKKESRELGLNPIDVSLVSAAKGYNIREAAAAIDEYRNGKDVYIVGCTNVGKSTFINRIIKEVTGEGDVITTSHFPGTTLDMIEIPLEDGKAIVDTPGIINHHQMAHYVDKRDLKFITPKKEIKPKVYQLNEEQTLFFGGLARFDYISGGRRSFSCYVPNEINIHRTKLEKADELYENHAGELLTPPRREQMDEFPELVRHEFTIKEAKTDVVFSGLGWITVNDAGAKIAAHVPKGVHVMLRRSLI